MIKECPRCRQRYCVDAFTGDYVHQCGEQPTVSEVLRNEDVKVVGDWEDYTSRNTYGRGYDYVGSNFALGVGSFVSSAFNIGPVLIPVKDGKVTALNCFCSPYSSSSPIQMAIYKLTGLGSVGSMIGITDRFTVSNNLGDCSVNRKFNISGTLPLVSSGTRYVIIVACSGNSSLDFGAVKAGTNTSMYYSSSAGSIHPGVKTFSVSPKLYSGWLEFNTEDVVAQNNINFQGQENKLFGTDADIDGERTHEHTSRGNIKSIFRTRKYEEYIEI